VRDAGGAVAPIGQPGQRLRCVALRRFDQSHSAAGDALPARVAELAGDRKGVLQRFARRVHAPFEEIDVREDRFGQSMKAIHFSSSTSSSERSSISRAGAGRAVSRCTRR